MLFGCEAFGKGHESMVQLEEHRARLAKAKENGINKKNSQQRVHSLSLKCVGQFCDASSRYLFGAKGSPDRDMDQEALHYYALHRR